MIIIVEGIDRVGKTTLCNALSKELGMPICKHTEKIMDYVDMDNLNETDKMLQILNVCDTLDANIIFDRFHFSDYVYGIVERLYNVQDANANFVMLDRKLHDMRAVIIRMLPTDLDSSSQQHGKNLKRYNELMGRCCVMSTADVYYCDYNHIGDTIKHMKEIYNGVI